MKLKMVVQLVGPQFQLEPGDEREFPQDEAVRLISAGIAVPVADSQIELAIDAPPPERRRKRRGNRIS